MKYLVKMKVQIKSLFQTLLYTIVISLISKGQLISGWLLDVFIWTKKWKKIFLYFCPTKIGQIKKRMQIIILEDK